MSEQKQGDFNLDELFQGGGLDLGGAQSDYDPFAQEERTFPQQSPDEPKEQEYPGEPDDSDDSDEPEDSDNVTELPASMPQKQGTVNKQPEINPPAKPTAKVVTPDFNPLAAAVNKAEEQNVKAGAASILAKPPVFTYGSASEGITDKALTFEQLRIDKAADFPDHWTESVDCDTPRRQGQFRLFRKGADVL